MANENKLRRDELKKYFQAGKIPTDQHFADLITAGINQVDDGIKAENGNLILKLDKGQVGIGAQRPAAKLHVNGTTQIEEKLTLVKGANVSGNVGIGINNPTVALHVNGNQSEIARFENSTNKEAGIQLQTSEGIAHAAALYNRTGGKLALWTGADALTVDRSQNVGIGTGSPESKLHINGKVTLESGQEIVFKDNGQISSHDNNHRILFRREEDILELREYGKIVLSAGSIDGTEKKSMVIEKGAVNIGTEAASANLHVHGRIEDKTGALMPVGAIIAYGGSTPPNGWVLCNGDWYDQNGEYNDLYQAIKKLHTNTEDSKSQRQFQVPDLRSRFVVGEGLGNGLTEYKLGVTGGEEMHTLSKAEMPSHWHYTWGEKSPNGAPFGHSDSQVHNGSNGGTDSDNYWYKTDETGGSEAHNNLPPYYALTYIIKC